MVVKVTVKKILKGQGDFVPGDALLKEYWVNPDHVQAFGPWDDKFRAVVLEHGVLVVEDSMTDLVEKFGST
jgi:hypothetical protein